MYATDLIVSYRLDFFNIFVTVIRFLYTLRMDFIWGKLKLSQILYFLIEHKHW